MSALQYRSVLNDFSELGKQPKVNKEELLTQLNTILDITGLKEKYDAALGVENPPTLIVILKHVCKICYSHECKCEVAVSIIPFLVSLYSEHGLDDQVKNALIKCLKSCPENLLPQLSTAFSRKFCSLIKKYFNDQHKTELLFKMVNEYSELFQERCLIEFVVKMISNFEYQSRKAIMLLNEENSPIVNAIAIRCVHQGFRLFLTTYHYNFFNENMELLARLIDCFFDLLTTEKLPMEVLFNCCLCIVYINKLPALKYLKMVLKDFETRSCLGKLAFIAALLNAYTNEELKIIDPCSGENICAILFNATIDSCAGDLNDCSIILSSSRVLLVLSKRLCTCSEIDFKKHQLQCLIATVWIYLDYFMDTVRHTAKDTMMNIIKMKNDNVLCEIMDRLSTSNIHSRAFINVFVILSNKVDVITAMKCFQNGADDILDLMNSNSSAHTIFINLMVNHFKITDFKIWSDYWLHPLFRKIDQVNINHFEKIITKAVSLTPAISKYINDLNNQTELSLKIYLIYIKIEKNVYLTTNDNGDWMNETYYEALKKALHNKDENIRFMAVNLVLDCRKKTQPFTKMELELMKYFITYNMKNEKPSIKETSLSLIKKMLLRMNDSQSSVAVKNKKSLNASVTKCYTRFQHWFSNFCFQNLFYDANFFRRNFSLRSLHLIQTCLLPKGIIGLNKKENISTLFNCIWDTYEKNKILAKDILTHKCQESIKLDIVVIEDILNKSMSLTHSNSPSDCITAGYLLETMIILNTKMPYEDFTFNILLDLNESFLQQVKVGKENLSLASASAPMYGTLHTIRHIMNTLDWQTVCEKKDWMNFMGFVSKFCLESIKLVTEIIIDSSPEGQILNNDSTINDHEVSSQMILVCGWRTAKESSLLLSDIVRISETRDILKNPELIVQICESLTLLLSETKHRGAFEQIFVAYSTVCSVMWKSSKHKIPQKLLEDVLTDIETGTKNLFCCTRRSAGMPFIIQALICTNPDKWQVINFTMEKLLVICENKSTTDDSEDLERVVHSLNVLRVLFRCSELRDQVVPYVSRAIHISIVLFNSSSWPVRNSSTLLLSALINRVFGVPRSSTELSWKNRMTGQVFFTSYPELYDTFLNEFKKFSPTDMRPSLYPTLLILSRLYQSQNKPTDSISLLESYIPYIFKCAQSPVMKTRMLAAISIAPQVTQFKLVEHLNITLNELTNKHLKENTTHGLLLQIFSLVENIPQPIFKQEELEKFTMELIIKYDEFAKRSHVIQEIFLRCITRLWTQLNLSMNDFIENVYTSTLESVTKLIQSDVIGRSKYLESAVLFLFSVSLKAQTDFSIVSYNVMKYNMHCETLYEILSTVLSIIPVKFSNKLEQFKNLEWNHCILMNQFKANQSLIELICQQCTIIDSLIYMKHLVLSNFTPALQLYFKTYESIDDFLLKVFHLKKDNEIAQALLCVNRYFHNLEPLTQPSITNLAALFENIYYAKRSDECKIVSVDMLVDNYNLIIKDLSLDTKTFLRLWTLILYYSEDNSEEVRNHVWCLVNKDTNCAKSYELLFDKFAEHFDQFPSAVLVALICWSYLDLQVPQIRPKYQVFEAGDTCEFKEHTIRYNLILDTIKRLTNNHSKSIDLEINKDLQEWITEKWTSDFDVKPTAEDLMNIGDFLAFAKNYYLKTTELIQNTVASRTINFFQKNTSQQR